MTPLKAVTAVDPYPYYSGLVEQKPLYFDHSLKMWVASNAYFVKTLLSDERLKVRPESEPVPSALLGLRSGAVFGSLMRMTDGPIHCPLKSAAVYANNLECANECGRLASEFAKTLQDGSSDASSLDVLRRLMFLLPTYTVGGLLGVAQDDLDRLCIEVNTFVAGISPLATTEQRTLGDCGTRALSDRIERLVEQKPEAGILLKRFFATAIERSIDKTTIIRNIVGFLFQTYDASAGLIGNSLRLLARNEALHRTLREDHSRLRRFVWEVMRFDPPVQNTRRFAVEDIRLDDLTIRANEQILLILAAANRDPSEYADPNHFYLDRTGPAPFAFGLGKHECPGQPLALEITCGALRVLLISSFPWNKIAETLAYRPSLNTRVPLY